MPPDQLAALRELDARLRGTHIVWALTGSLGFAVQGLPITPHDIDVQTDAAGAYAIERLFAEAVVAPVGFREAARIRSHFGALRIGTVAVEIMGDIQKRRPDGEWDDSLDLNTIRDFLQLEDMRVPVLSLDYERVAYLALGRHETARLLEEWIHRSGAGGSRATEGPASR